MALHVAAYNNHIGFREKSDSLGLELGYYLPGKWSV